MAADPVSASFAPLHDLNSLITSSLTSLETACKDVVVPWPSLDEPSYMSKTGISREDFIRMKNDAIVRASTTLIAAAMQLVNTVREPMVTVGQVGMSFPLASAVRIVTELHVVDILRDAGPEGLHVGEIAKKVQVDSSKLERILRLLATHHIFAELRPSVFRNNRVSAVLEKGQSVEALLANPAAKYDHPVSAPAAMMSHACDDVFKPSAYLFETLVDPEIGFSGSPSKSAYVASKKLLKLTSDTSPSSKIKEADHTTSAQGAEKLDEDIDLDGPTVWDYMARQEAPLTRFGFEGEALKRFGVGMDGMSKFQPVAELLQGFDFASLPPPSVVVDVGGGVGTVAQVLTEKYENLKVVVQDRKEVCEEGVRRWKETNPKALEMGRVAFQIQDFFSPQPSNNLDSKPAAFILKSVLHDWSDPYCRFILKHLRDAAGSNSETRLLVLDNLLPYACNVESGDEGGEGKSQARSAVPGTYQDLAQPPLLRNWGEASALPYLGDILLLISFNGQERTLEDARSLFRSAGWEVVKVTQLKTVGQPFSLVEAKAA